MMNDLMYDIEVIVNEIEANKALKSEYFDEKGFWFRPEYITEYILHTLTLPIRTIKKASYHKALSKVLAFINIVKPLRKKDACTIMPIPTTNKNLMELCGNQREVSRLIKIMRELNLIEAYDNSYIFNHHKANRSKIYCYYVEVEKELINYCKANNIEVYEAPNVEKAVPIVNIDEIDEATVSIGTKLKLLKPRDMSTEAFSAAVSAVLIKKYPVMAEYQAMADYINKTFYQNDDSFQIKFNAHVQFNGGLRPNRWVKKIGIRATNKLVSIPNKCPEKTIVNENGETVVVIDANKLNYLKKNNNDKVILRSDILAANGLDLSYDVKSSVPRLTFSLNNGYWEPGMDCYKEINDEMLTIKYYMMHPFNFNSNVNRYNIKNYISDYTYNREAVKKLFMFAYFDSSVSDIAMGSHVRHNMRDKKNKEKVYMSMRVFKKAVKNVLGDIIGSEIFLHESCIYMDVTRKLLEDGFKVWQVYDAWYAHKDGVSEVDYAALVEKYIEESFDDYIAKIN